MSSIILLLLAMAIIFWRPPFRLPQAAKRAITPIILLIILSSLLLLGTFKPYANGDSLIRAELQADAGKTVYQQTQLTR